MKLNDKQKKIAIGVGCAVVPLLIWLGFSERNEDITQCKVTAKNYITANYSREVPDTCYDEDGNPYQCWTTKHWSLAASEVNVTITIDGNITNQNSEVVDMGIGAYWRPVQPQHNLAMANNYDFDRFSFTKTESLSISTYDKTDGERSVFSEPAYKNPLCINMLQKEISVKTWYSISYGSDFL